MTGKASDAQVWPYCLSYSDMLPKHETALSAELDNGRAPAKRPRDLSKLDQIEIQFLGTVSAQPTPTRAHSCLAVRLGGEGPSFDLPRSSCADIFSLAIRRRRECTAPAYQIRHEVRQSQHHFYHPFARRSCLWWVTTELTC